MHGLGSWLRLATWSSTDWVDSGTEQRRVVCDLSDTLFRESIPSSSGFLTRDVQPGTDIPFFNLSAASKTIQDRAASKQVP